MHPREYRAAALEWWRQLTEEQQDTMVSKHYPDWAHAPTLVKMPSYRIEQMWKLENNLP